MKRGERSRIQVRFSSVCYVPYISCCSWTEGRKRLFLPTGSGDHRDVCNKQILEEKALVILVSFHITRFRCWKMLRIDQMEVGEKANERRLMLVRFIEWLIDISLSNLSIRKILVINVVSYHTRLPAVQKYLYRSPVYLPIILFVVISFSFLFF